MTRQAGERPTMLKPTDMTRLLEHPAVRWGWLIAILVAAAMVPALTRNTAALAYDAAMEHVPRGVVFSQAVSDGVLYPRWTQFLHWGLGSPLFTFQPPLPYYGLDLLYRLGLPHPIGWRLLMAAGLLAAFFGTYLLVRAVTGQKWPAIVAGVAYLYAPYVIRNSLERGSNEAYGMFLYPWVLWGLIWVARRPTMGRFLLAALLWAACIASHVLAPLMLLPFALLLAAYLAWRHSTWTPLGVLLAGGLLTAAVWMPMAPEQSYVHIERDFAQPEAIPARNALPLDALLAPPAIYDLASDNNGTGDRAGVLSALILLAGIPAAIFAWIRRRRALAAALGASTLAGLLLFWLLTVASDPVWNLPGLAPLLARLLYRTRLMGVLSLAVACTAGLAVALLSQAWQRAVGLLLAALLVLAALPSLYVDLQHRYGSFDAAMSLADVRDTEISTGGNALAAFGEFTPRWRDEPFDQVLLDQLGPDHDSQIAPLTGLQAGVEVQAARVASSSWDLDLTARQPVTLSLNLLYYPRWQARLDGQPLALRPQPQTGYVEFFTPAGNYHISLRYTRTIAETAGLIISGLALLTLLGAALWGVARGDRVKKEIAQLPGAQLPASAHSPAAFEARRGNPSLWLLLGASALLVVKFAYVDPATTWFRCVSTAERVCGADATVDIPFPGGPRLRGYSVPTYQAKAGDALRVTLFWQGEPGVTRRLSSFVHVRNSRPDQPVNPQTGSDIWAQMDQFTPGGLPTEEQKPGRLYKDELRVPLPKDMPPGVYFLEVGLADYASGEQLDPLSDAIKPPLGVLWRSVLLPPVTIQ
jgi:hypothetical protein